MSRKTVMPARSSATHCSPPLRSELAIPWPKAGCRWTRSRAFLLSQESQERVEGVGDPMERLLAHFLFGPVVDPALVLAAYGNAQEASLHRILHLCNRQEPRKIKINPV